MTQIFVNVTDSDDLIQVTVIDGEKGDPGEDGTGGGASFEALLVTREGSMIIDRDGEPVTLRS